MSGFFEELKRRKVYRVAVAYVIAAAGIIQMASAVFPAWDLPEWTLRLTIGARSSAGMIRSVASPDCVRGLAMGLPRLNSCWPALCPHDERNFEMHRAKMRSTG